MAPFYYLLVFVVFFSSTSAHIKNKLSSGCSLNSLAVSLDIGEDAFSNSTDYEYEGLSIISLQVTAATSTLQFHASHEYISITLILLDNVQISTWEIDNSTDIVTLTLDSELVTGKNYSLLINYSSKLSTNDTFGLYRTSYTNSNGTKSYFLGTRFEPTYARRVFPCFDEPEYKAPFTFSVRHPSNCSSLSNTEAASTATSGTLTTVSFNTTSNTSSYLVSWAISDFNSTENTLSDGSSKCRIWSRNASTSSREWALNVTSRLIDSLNTLTGVNFTNISSKVDLLAVPDTSEEVAESCGLLTFRESELLWDSEESTTISKKNVAKSIARGLAYQWFGSLVTTKWWNSVYLSEGLANYFAQLALNETEPDYEASKEYVVKNLQGALESDSKSKTQSVESRAKSNAEVSRKLGTISSDKGGCLFRMAENFLGNDSFKAGVTQYLSTYKNQNVDSTELWDSLNSTANFTKSSLPADVNTIMDNWISEPGYPVINVSLKDNTVTFKQERFLESGSDCLTKWYVPISYIKSDDNSSEWESTYPRLWLTPDKPTASISINSSTKWLLVNNKQSGYYRVNYDSTLWKRLTIALDKTNFSNISEENRAQICDDAFNLAKANLLSYSKALDIVQFLQDDDSYYSWSAAFKGFDNLIKRVGQYSSLGSSISNKVLKLSKKVRQSAPITTLNSSNTVYTQKQNLVNDWACKLGDKDTIKYAREQFEEYKKTSVRPNKDVRNIVYSHGLRYSNSATNDWNFLWKAYQESEVPSERETLVEALGCTTNKEVLNNYLEKTISNDSDALRNEDRAAAFSAVYKGSSDGVDVALDFLTKNHKAISDKYNGKKNVGKIVKGISEQLSREDQVTKLTTFVSNNDLDEEIRAYANDGIEVAQINLQWTKQYQSELSNYYRVEESCQSSSLESTVVSKCSCSS